MNGLDVAPFHSPSRGSPPSEGFTMYATVYGSWNTVLPQGHEILRIDVHPGEEPFTYTTNITRFAWDAGTPPATGVPSRRNLVLRRVWREGRCSPLMQLPPKNRETAPQARRSAALGSVSLKPSQRTHVSRNGVIGPLKILRVPAPFERRRRRGLRLHRCFHRPNRTTAPVFRTDLKVPRSGSVVVLADKVVALNKAHDAVVHDVEDARFVEHLEDVLMFRTGLEPEQRHDRPYRTGVPHGLPVRLWARKNTTISGTMPSSSAGRIGRPRMAPPASLAREQPPILAVEVEWPDALVRFKPALKHIVVAVRRTPAMAG